MFVVIVWISGCFIVIGVWVIIIFFGFKFDFGIRGVVVILFIVKYVDFCFIVVSCCWICDIIEVFYVVVVL